MIVSKRNTYIGLVCLAIAAIYFPDSGQKDAHHRALEASKSSEESVPLSDENGESGRRRLATDVHVDISEFQQPFTCSNPGEVFGSFDWDSVQLSDAAPNPQVFSSGGVTLGFSKFAAGDAVIKGFNMHTTGGSSYPRIGITNVIKQEDVITSGAATNTPPFPDSYVTMEIEFSEAMRGLSISNGDVDSSDTTDVVRIRMFDESGADIGLKLSVDHPNIELYQDYAWMNTISTGVKNPGFDASLYAKPQDSTIPVKKISLDLGLFAFTDAKVGRTGNRWMYPGLDFKFCKIETPSPTDSPVAGPPLPTAQPTPEPTPEPTPDPTPEPTSEPTAGAVPAPKPTVGSTPAPTTVPKSVTVTPDPTSAPTSAPIDTSPGVSGDPIIMGLGGQIFKFVGRSGSWYSAVSTKSFQWNMGISKFEGCPADSDTFTTGMGLTLFGSDGRQHRIEVNVANPQSVFTGCGLEDDKDADYGCLGAGSLELMIDGHKVVKAIDHFLDDDMTTRVTAYNIISKCSRRWFDFDITPAEEINTSRSLKQLRGIGIFETLERVKETMIDKEGCQEWIAERRANNDLLRQTGTWSTVIIQTETVSFHMEYKQEMERCNAHNLDVWISEVSPEALNEHWEGILGETKTTERTQEKRMMHRGDVLKFPYDEDYEVLSPFTTECQACIDRRGPFLRKN